jgi:2-keto-3-deoxy-L-rhamnonate aldolase RhmA
MGHYDLTVSMGIPAQFEHPRFLDVMDSLLNTAGRYGVACGFLPPNSQAASYWVRKGFRVISLGSDIGVFLYAVEQFRSEVQNTVEKAEK